MNIRRAAPLNCARVCFQTVLSSAVTFNSIPKLSTPQDIGELFLAGPYPLMRGAFRPPALVAGETPFEAVLGDPHAEYRLEQCRARHGQSQSRARARAGEAPLP